MTTMNCHAGYRGVSSAFWAREGTTLNPTVAAEICAEKGNL